MTPRQRGPIFPILLAALWIVFTALALGDFAEFSASTRPQAPAQAAAERPAPTSGRSGRRGPAPGRGGGGPTRRDSPALSLTDEAQN